MGMKESDGDNGSVVGSYTPRPTRSHGSHAHLVCCQRAIGVQARAPAAGARTGALSQPLYTQHEADQHAVMRILIQQAEPLAPLVQVLCAEHAQCQHRGGAA